MKNLVIAFGILALTFFMTFSLIALNTNANQKNKVEETTRTVLYQTLKECKDPEAWPVIQMKYTAAAQEGELSKEDIILVKRFRENLCEIMKSSEKQKISYKVVAADWEKGILSVEVINTYQNLGLKKVVKAKKTVIYDTKK